MIELVSFFDRASDSKGGAKGTALEKAIVAFDDRVPRALPWAIVLRPAGAGLKPPLAISA